MVDIVIVGAGSAGCVLANRLSADPARQVLLLEAGHQPPLASDIPSDWPTMFNTAVDWGYHTEPQTGCRGRRLFWPRGRMVGGSGALNAMIYIRGLPSDYGLWAALGCKGWSWADVLPAFKASEHNADIDDAFHGQGGPLHVGNVPYVDPAELAWLEACKAEGLHHNPDFNGSDQSGVGFFQLTVRNGERWGTGKAYLRPALDRPNLAVETGVFTTRILLENGRATGVEYLRNGRLHVVHAARVVLSAGAIGSCHLLLLSGIGPADELRVAGVEPVHHLPGVGKDLQDHINVPITFHTREPIGIGGWTDMFLAESLREWRTRRTGPRTSPWAAAGGFVRSRPDVEPDLQLYGMITPHRDHARYLSSRAGITLHSTLQRPESRGEIRLRSADPLDHPIIDPRYFESDASGSDLATLVEGVRTNRRIAAQAPLAVLIEGEIPPSAGCETTAEIAHFVRGHCTTLYHPTSTCRMGTDAMAVVDPASLEVHGIDGLHVADASVFPRMVSGNVNAPTIMVAERAAGMILRQR